MNNLKGILNDDSLNINGEFNADSLNINVHLQEAGPQGVKGDKGEDGIGITVIGSLDSENDLPLTGESGDSYLINGNLYV